MPRDPRIWPAPDLMRVCLFLLMVVTLSRIHQHLGLEALRPALLLAAVAAVYAGLNPRTLRPGNLRTLPAMAVMAMGVFAVASVPFALSLGASAGYFLSDFSKVLLFALFITLAIRTGQDLFLFVVGYVTAVGGLVWMALTVFDLDALGPNQVTRLGDMYSYDANDAGLIMITTIPLCILLFQRVGRLGKAALVATLVGIGWAIAFTGSRGTFVALLVLGLAILLTHRGMSFVKRTAVVVTIVGAMLVAAPPGYWQQMRTILTIQEDYNWQVDDGRLALARRGVGYMLDRPLTGLGLANFGRAEGTISEPALRAMPGVGIRWNAPHNSYIQAGAELGIGGGIAFLVLVFGGMAFMLRLHRRIPPAWRTGTPEEQFLSAAPYFLFLSYLGFASAALFLSFAYLDPIYLLSAFAAGAFVSVRRRLIANEEAAFDPTAPEMEPVPAMIPGMRGGLARIERGS